MKSMRVKTDDEVEVVGGKDAGKRGRVTRTEPKRRRVYVEGLNMVKRHERPRPAPGAKGGKQQLGGIVEKEGPIDVSNVRLIDPTDDKPTRVGVRRKDGKLERYSKRTGVGL